MCRFLPLVVLLSAAPLRGADAPSVGELVERLGSPRYAVRENAQKELVKRGEGIVPELDRLVKSADAETADRIGKIRYVLVGYKDDIVRLMTEVQEGKDSASVPVTDELRGLIAGHQPGAGDLLLGILADPKHALHRRALRTFVATWDAATADQIDRYVRQAVTLNTSHRPKFPAKVGAMISFEAQLRGGWTGWPNQAPAGFAFRTRTTRYLDGKPYDKLFEYQYPFATVGWYRVGELAEGKHTIYAVLAYEFTQNGQKRKGEIRSKDSTFEVMAANAPDELIAPKSVATSKDMRAAFHFEGVGAISESTAVEDLSAVVGQGRYPPQVTWDVSPGIRAGLRCVEWHIQSAPSVDLCFDVEIHDLGSGKVYPADPICVTGDATASGYIVPRDPRAFAANRDGLVRIKVVFKPSRAVALTDVRIKKYYPEPITSDVFQMKVVSKIVSRVELAR